MAKRVATLKERPTEWTAAVAMLATAMFMFSVNKDSAALVATVAACLPALVTALVEYARRRAADAVPDLPLET